LQVSDIRSFTESEAVRLYRGIAVPEPSAAEVIDAIGRDGLAVEGRFWSGLAVHDLKSRLSQIWRSSDLDADVSHDLRTV
jgi:hypothetical protein